MCNARVHNIFFEVWHIITYKWFKFPYRHSAHTNVRVCKERLMNCDVVRILSSRLKPFMRNVGWCTSGCNAKKKSAENRMVKKSMRKWEREYITHEGGMRKTGNPNGWREEWEGMKEGSFQYKGDINILTLKVMSLPRD